MKKRILAALMAAVLAFSMLSATAFAQTDVDLSQQEGTLLITEPGSYVLQGKLTGCVTVSLYPLRATIPAPVPPSISTPSRISSTSP